MQLLNPMLMAKCVLFSYFGNVNARRLLCQCLARKESISRPCDLTWFHLCLSLQRKNDFFTYAINFDTVIFIINIIITLVFLTLLTAISNTRKQVIIVFSSLETWYLQSHPCVKANTKSYSRHGAYGRAIPDGMWLIGSMLIFSTY